MTTGNSSNDDEQFQRRDNRIVKQRRKAVENMVHKWPMVNQLSKPIEMLNVSEFN